MNPWTVRAVVLLLIALGAAGLALLQRPAPEPEPASAPERVTPRALPSRVAVHEAGHVVAAWFCTGVTRVIEATIDSSHAGIQGHVSKIIMLRDADDKWCALAGVLAGMAAEMLVYRSVKSNDGAQNDLVAARKIASEVAGTQAPWVTPDVARVPDLARCFSKPMTADEKLALAEGYWAARELVRAHEVCLLAVARALDERVTLDEAALTKVLGSRSYLKALAVLPARLVIPNHKDRST